MSDIVFTLPGEKKTGGAPKVAPQTPAAAATSAGAEDAGGGSDIVFEPPKEKPLALSAGQTALEYLRTALGAPNSAKNYLVSKLLGVGKKEDSPLNAPSFNQMADRAGRVPGLSTVQDWNKKIFGNFVAEGSKKFLLGGADAVTDPLNYAVPGLKGLGLPRAAEAMSWATLQKPVEKMGASMFKAGASPAIENMLENNPKMTSDEAMELLMKHKVRGSRSAQLQKAGAAADALENQHIGVPQQMTDAGMSIPYTKIDPVVKDLRDQAKFYRSAGGMQNHARAQELDSLANALEGRDFDPQTLEKNARNYRSLRYADPALEKDRNHMTGQLRDIMGDTTQEAAQNGVIPRETADSYLPTRQEHSKMISARDGLQDNVEGAKSPWMTLGTTAVHPSTVMYPGRGALRAGFSLTKGAMPWVGTNIGELLKRYPQVLSTPVRQGVVYPDYVDPNQKIMNELSLDQ